MDQIPFNRPSVVGNEFLYLQEAINRGQLSGDGHFTHRCNTKIESITGAKAALLTHSCTAALEMAAILCGIEPGDEVIMPSFTFVSTANAVALRGGVPVFVDIDSKTLNLAPDQVSTAVTGKTKAIFAVHYAGNPADMDALNAIARQHNLFVVEDAAQSLGALYRGKPSGSLGDMAAFSFHETKNIISGEGGALTINREELIERAEIIREKGTNRSRFIRGQVDKYTWVDIGSSFLPGELVAAFLLAQLEKVQEINERRVRAYNRYLDAFSAIADSERIKMPAPQNDVTGNGHLFYLLLKDIEDRDRFIRHMKENGITTPFHYIPLHSAPAGKKFGRANGDLPVTDNISSRLVRLPIFYDLGDDVDKVISVVRAYFG